MRFPSRFLPRSFPLAGRRRSQQCKDLTRTFPFFPHLAPTYPIVGVPTRRRAVARWWICWAPMGESEGGLR